MKWFTVFLSLYVLSGHIISASYPALHALHLVQQNAALGQQNQQHSPSLEQNSDSSKLANDLTSTATSSEDYDAHPQYSFAYDVKDSLTGDDKQQEEQRDGDVVQGQYSLIEPDGTRRVVEYTADDANGFNAVVSKQTLTEPQQLLHTSPVAGISSSSQYNSIEVLQSQLQEHSIAEAQAQSAAYAEAQALAEAQVRAEAIAQSKQNEQDKLQLEAQKQLQQKLQHAEEQQQLLRSQLEQSQEHLTNEQALLLSQSLPNQVLGHSVHTTVVSHPPTLLSRSPSGSVFSHTSDISSLKDIHDNAASHLTIERTVHPQIVITQPASATIQASILHSPLTLLDAVANGNGLQSSSFISNRIFNSGHTTSNGNLLLDSNVGHTSEQLSKNLDSSDLHASAVNENGKTNGHGNGNGNGNSNDISHGIANNIALSNDNGNGIIYGTDNDKSLRNGLNQQQPERLQTTYINGNGKTIW